MQRNSHTPYVPKDRKEEIFLALVTDRASNGVSGSNQRIAETLGYGGDELDAAAGAVGHSGRVVAKKLGYRIGRQKECRAFMRDLKALRKSGDAVGLPKKDGSPGKAVSKSPSPSPEPAVVDDSSSGMTPDRAIGVLRSLGNPLLFIEQLVRIPKFCDECATPIMPMVVARNRPPKRQVTAGELQGRLSEAVEALNESRDEGQKQKQEIERLGEMVKDLRAKLEQSRIPGPQPSSSPADQPDEVSDGQKAVG